MPNAHQPDDISRAKVTALVMAGVQQQTIAEVIGIAATTLRGHYRSEIDYGMANANSVVAARLYDLCRQGNLGALIFWAKTRMGWRETGELQITVGLDVDGQDPVATFRERIETMRGRRIAEASSAVVEVVEVEPTSNGARSNGR
jgi:predicted DNA-binding protein (UPF0278 family)